MGPDLINVLSNIERKDDKQPYVFPSGKTHLKTIRRPFIAACEAAGIAYGREKGLIFHDLRHVAASRLVKVTDVVTASKILGHSDISMTMRYVHPTDMDKRAAINRLGDWLRGRQKDANGSKDQAKIASDLTSKNPSVTIN